MRIIIKYIGCRLRPTVLLHELVNAVYAIGLYAQEIGLQTDRATTDNCSNVFMLRSRWTFTIGLHDPREHRRFCTQGNDREL